MITTWHNAFVTRAYHNSTWHYRIDFVLGPGECNCHFPAMFSFLKFVWPMRVTGFREMMTRLLVPCVGLRNEDTLLFMPKFYLILTLHYKSNVEVWFKKKCHSKLVHAKYLRAFHPPASTRSLTAILSLFLFSFLFSFFLIVTEVKIPWLGLGQGQGWQLDRQPRRPKSEPWLSAAGKSLHAWMWWLVWLDQWIEKWERSRLAEGTLKNSSLSSSKAFHKDMEGRRAEGGELYVGSVSSPLGLKNSRLEWICGGVYTGRVHCPSEIERLKIYVLFKELKHTSLKWNHRHSAILVQIPLSRLPPALFKSPCLCSPSWHLAI